MIETKGGGNGFEWLVGILTSGAAIATAIRRVMSRRRRPDVEADQLEAFGTGFRTLKEMVAFFEGEIRTLREDMKVLQAAHETCEKENRELRLEVEQLRRRVETLTKKECA